MCTSHIQTLFCWESGIVILVIKAKPMGKAKSETGSFPVEFVDYSSSSPSGKGGHYAWLTRGLWSTRVLRRVSRWTGRRVGGTAVQCTGQWLWLHGPVFPLTAGLRIVPLVPHQEAVRWAASSGAAFPVKTEPAQSQARHFKSRSACWSASLADLGLPRRGFYGAFPSAERSCRFHGISPVAKWFRWAQGYRKELACPPGWLLMVCATRNQAQHQGWGKKSPPMAYHEPLPAILETLCIHWKSRIAFCCPNELRLTEEPYQHWHTCRIVERSAGAAPHGSGEGRRSPSPSAWLSSPLASTLWWRAPVVKQQVRAQEQGTYDGVWGKNMTNVIASHSNNSLFGLKNAQATESVTGEERVLFGLELRQGGVY